MNEVLKLPRYTIVRTQTGDHEMLNADAVINQIRHWYDRRHLKCFWSEGSRKRTLIVEIGNEPNIGARAGAEAFGNCKTDKERFLAVSSGFGDQVGVVPAWRVDEGVVVSLGV